MRKLSLLALVLGFAACRDNGSSGDDTGGTDSNTGGGDVKIQDVQDPAMTNGTPVTLKGVVVTAIDAYGSKTGDIWVQEPEGGEFSGIHVYGAPLDAVAGLTVGAIINISGAEKDDFMYSDFEEGFAITELKPVAGGVMTIQTTGMTMVLQPQKVNALAIGALTDYKARADEWEKWEGVLIEIENVRATTDQACVGSACNDTTLQKLEVTGDVVVESAIAAFPYDRMNAMAFKKGDCINKVTGVLDYFFDYLLLPRDLAEYGTATGTCPTEDTMTTCSDGMDNDGNGFTDCNDNACITSVASCRTTTTITAIQTAGTPPTGGVELTDVRVMAVSYNKKNIWVATNATAAANEGIYVLGPGTNLDGFAVGSKVNVIGKVVEFNDTMGTETLTEIKALTVTAGTSGTTAPTPVSNQTAATLAVALTGEPYESVLVTLNNVRISTASIPCTGGAMPPACNYGLGQAKQGTGVVTTFKIDDDILAAATGCYATITGVWTYLVYENEYGFLPKTLGTTGTMCPP